MTCAWKPCPDSLALLVVAFLALRAALVPTALLGQAAAARPGSLHFGFARDRLARIDAFLQEAVDSNRVAGVVALVLRDGNVVYERAVGWADRESRRRMTTDAMFRIASQTKALTTIATMILLEEGKVALNNPVSRFIPEFVGTTVAVRTSSGERQVVPAARAITIRDLLTHISGISYGTDSIVADQYAALGLGASAGSGGWYLADKNEPVCALMQRVGRLPFVRQPGEAWVYGYSTDVLGCVVERASGSSLAEFFRSRITGPLRMTDTHFFVPESQRQRLVAVYMSDSTNRAVRAPDGVRGQGHYVDGPRMTYSGGAGLVSTARDYARLLQMLLNGGELDGVRILSPGSVELMATNQTDSLFPLPGNGFGFGFSIVDRRGADNTLAPAGTYGWGGAYGSQYKVDPKTRVILVLMLNQLPNRSDVASKFPNLVYQALVR
jgi:CubicO group peptidase (beta-lactamase class C family)